MFYPRAILYDVFAGESYHIARFIEVGVKPIAEQWAKNGYPKFVRRIEAVVFRRFLHRVPKFGRFRTAVNGPRYLAVKGSAFGVEQNALYSFQNLGFLGAFFRFRVKGYGVSKREGYGPLYYKFLNRQGYAGYRLDTEVFGFPVSIGNGLYVLLFFVVYIEVGKVYFYLLIPTLYRVVYVVAFGVKLGDIFGRVRLGRITPVLQFGNSGTMVFACQKFVKLLAVHFIVILIVKHYAKYPAALFLPVMGRCSTVPVNASGASSWAFLPTFI